MDVEEVAQELVSQPLVGDETFNPVTLVRVANRLIDMGPDKAQLVIYRACQLAETLSLHHPDVLVGDSIANVIAIAYLVEETRLERPGSGNYGIRANPESAIASTFPAHVVHDIPFVLSYPESPSSVISPRGYFGYILKHGQLRRQRLHPSKSPLVGADSIALILRESKSVLFTDGKTYWYSQAYVIERVRLQAINAISALLTRAEIDVLRRAAVADAVWSSAIEHLSLAIVWDVGSQSFTRLH